MLNNERAQESRRTLNKRRKLEHIEAAARRLFADNGYANTTTRAIAEAADIGTGTLFLYFREKLDLLVHLYRQDLAQVGDRALADLRQDLPLAQACSQVFGALYDFYDQDIELARTFVKELMFLELERQPDMFKTTLRFIERLGELVAAAKQRGEVRQDVPVPLAAYQLFGVYYWCLVNWLGGRLGDRRAVGNHTRMMLDLLIRGLGGN